MIKKCCLETVYVEVTDDNIEQVVKDITNVEGSDRCFDIEKRINLQFGEPCEYFVRWREHLSGPVLRCMSLTSGKIYVRLNFSHGGQWMMFEPEVFYQMFAVQEENK